MFMFSSEGQSKVAIIKPDKCLRKEDVVKCMQNMHDYDTENNSLFLYKVKPSFP